MGSLCWSFNTAIRWNFMEIFINGYSGIAMRCTIQMYTTFLLHVMTTDMSPARKGHSSNEKNKKATSENTKNRMRKGCISERVWCHACLCKGRRAVHMMFVSKTLHEAGTKICEIQLHFFLSSLPHA
jgi:hypothetical protein